MMCPVCQHQMIPVRHHGKLAESSSILHCQNCGGSWFPSSEALKNISNESIIRLRSNVRFPRRPYITPKSLSCPNDKTDLKQFQNERAHLRLPMYMCSTCHGIWTSQKSLDAYKESQQKSPFSPPYAVVTAAAILFLLSVFSILVFRFTLRQPEPINLFQLSEAEVRLPAPFVDMHVERLTNDTVRIIFTTEVAGIGIISYSQEGQKSSVRISTRPETYHETTLSGIRSGIPLSIILYLQKQDGKIVSTNSYLVNLKEAE